MIGAKHHPQIIWLFATLITVQLGCAHTSVSSQNAGAPPLSKEARTQLGTIGVASARFAPEAERHMIEKKGEERAGKYAEAGLLAALRGGAMSGHPVGLLVGIALAPVFAVGGSIYGGVTAEPTKTVQELETGLKSVLVEMRIQEAMRGRLLRVAREQAPHHLILFTEQGPTAPFENVSYPPLETEGIDAILEVTVLKLGLAGGVGSDPPLVFFMGVRTKLIRVMDETELHVGTWTYTSETRQLTEWTANDGQKFLEEVDKAYQNLAEKMVRAMFVLSE